MATVKADPNTLGPPPAYNEVVAEPSTSNNRLEEQTIPDLSTQPTRRTDVYGPTPIAQTQTVLPYYDPRSPYMREQAIIRARWRFMEALAWALGIWVAVGIVTGGIVIDVRRY